MSGITGLRRAFATSSRLPSAAHVMTDELGGPLSAHDSRCTSMRRRRLSTQAVWKQREIAVLAYSIRGESALESRSLSVWSLTMHRFIDGEDRMQQTLLPNSLEDYVSEENPVRVIEVFIDELDLMALGFSGMTPVATGRPAYHPSTLLKIYLYGYLNRLQSSRRLEPEAQRNIELMWLTGRLAPDFKTIADFRRNNGAAIRAVCGQFVELCRRLKLFTRAVFAIDGSKFKAVNNRDRITRLPR